MTYLRLLFLEEGTVRLAGPTKTTFCATLSDSLPQVKSVVSALGVYGVQAHPQNFDLSKI